MKNLKWLVYLFSLLIFALCSKPMSVSADTSKIGVLVGDNNKYVLYDKLIILSPSDSIMINAEVLCKEVGLDYQFIKSSQKIIISDKATGKSLEFQLKDDHYTYYSGKNTKGISETSKYQAYYDSKNKCNLIHYDTLKKLINVTYHSLKSDHYYAQLGYKAVIFLSKKENTALLQAPTTELTSGIKKRLKSYELEKFQLDKKFGEMDNASICYDIFTKDLFIPFDNEKIFTSSDLVYEASYYIIRGVYQSTLSDGSVFERDMEYQFSSSVPWHYEGYIPARWGIREIRFLNKGKHFIFMELLKKNPEVQPSVTSEVKKSLELIINKIITEGMSDYQKVKSIYDYVTYNYAYMEEHTYKQDPNDKVKDLISKGFGDSEAFACMVQLLLTQIKIESYIVYGMDYYYNQHEWNIVKINKDYFHIDTSGNYGGRKRYVNFLLSDKERQSSYAWNHEGMYEGFPVLNYVYPQCKKGSKLDPWWTLSFIEVIGEYKYYLVEDYGVSYNLVKERYDGSKTSTVTKLSDDDFTSPKLGDICDGWLYFTEDDDRNVINRINLKTGKIELGFYTNDNYLLEDFYVRNGWIYLVTYWNMTRFNIASKEEQEILNVEEGEYSYHSEEGENFLMLEDVVFNNKIYYCIETHSPKYRKIKEEYLQMNLDGSDIKERKEAYVY